MNAKKFKELQYLMMLGDSEEVPHGWYTRQQVAKGFGKSCGYADKILSDFIRKGFAERKMFRVPTASGVRPVPHFSFVTANEAQAKVNRVRPVQQSKSECTGTKRNSRPKRKRLR